MGTSRHSSGDRSGDAAGQKVHERVHEKARELDVAPPADKSARSQQGADDSLPLPHEADQRAGSQQERQPRGVGQQAHRDLERGMQDTDRRGGDEYQQRTQNDEHANRNARDEPKRDRKT